MNLENNTNHFAELSPHSLEQRRPHGDSTVCGGILAQVKHKGGLGRWCGCHCRCCDGSAQNKQKKRRISDVDADPEQQEQRAKAERDRR
jgi:hypothetical protein